MNSASGDHRFMARAIRLARRGLFTTEPNPRVGCVIVQNDSSGSSTDDRIVGEGWHEKAGEAHAEKRALEQAGELAAGATAYVTLEPCCHHGRTPPCTDALIAAAVKHVVIGAVDPNPAVAGQGIRQMQAAGITVEQGVMSDQCRALNPGFNQRMESGRPYIRSKIAASLDGRTALANGVSQWITGEAARLDVQRWRASSSAILTGVGTVLADDPSLDVRDNSLGEVLQPVRVIVDSSLRMPADARLLKLPGPTLVFCSSPCDEPRRALEASDAEIEVLADTGGRVDLAALMRCLAERQFNEILVEAGPTLNGALLAAGLIDELIIYQAGHVLGDEGRGMFSIGELSQMSQRPSFILTDVRRVGDDIRMTYKPGRPND
jgi:diaminohydroxyphosphoribosylaminopyrimidine deaminase/5-amino-6-(5-phosphoribosylamino)uracil reductase